MCGNPNRPTTLDGLVRDRGLTRDAADFLGAAMRGGCSVLVSGAAASGKTTLLNALGSALSGTSGRVISVESVPELRFDDSIPHYESYMFRREPDEPPRHEAEFRDLVQNAVQVRATRLLVDDIRGPEALHAVHGLYSGQLGAMAAIVTADSPRSALSSLVGYALLARDAPREQVIATFVRESIVFVAHVRQQSPGVPLLASIHEIVAPEQRTDGDGIELPSIPLWEERNGTLQRVAAPTRCLDRLRAEWPGDSPPWV